MLKICYLSLTGILILLYSCQKEKEYRLTGTFYEDCDQTIPLANFESTIRFDYLKGGRLLYKSIPIKTDENGKLDVIYSSVPKSHTDDRSNTMSLENLLLKVPHGEDFNLGKLTVKSDFYFSISLKFESVLSPNDTLFVQTTKKDSFIVLTSPFNDTVVGPFNWKGISSPDYQDGQLVFSTTARAFLNNKNTGNKYFGQASLFNCMSNQTVELLIKD